MEECEANIERLSAVHVTESYRGEVSFAPNPVLYHMDFRPTRERTLYERHAVEEDAYLRVTKQLQASGQSTDSGSENAAGERAYIGQHPIAARSFATATPAFNIFLVDFMGWSVSSDPMLTLGRPVTVLDVLQLIHREYAPLKLRATWSGSDMNCSLDKLMTVRGVYEHVESHAGCIEKKGWGVTEAFGNLQTIRGILELW